MSEICINCGADITQGGIIKGPNLRYSIKQVKIANFVNKSEYEELCEKCGKNIVESAFENIKKESEELQKYIRDNITYFPMMTIGHIPDKANFRIKSMVTANISVGTGIFNELSQGLSDMFGATSSTSGMAHKVNIGEAAARALIADKAFRMGANCVIGVDIDYGTTMNNAATVNMQGTAVFISNLNEILDEEDFSQFEKIKSSYAQIQKLSRLRQGDISEI